VKDDSLNTTLDALRRRFGPNAFVIQDHWADDQYAIGIAAPSELGQLVYISTFGKPAGKYDVTLERPPTLSDELPYESHSEWLELDFENLATCVAEHFGIHPIDQQPKGR